MTRARFATVVALLMTWWIGAVGYGQHTYEAFDVDHPAIGYHTTSPTDPVAVLNRELQAGDRQLRFDGPRGYLTSLLTALEIPVESQLAVYSKTSLQSARISPRNPRVIFFNDSTAVAWVPGGFIEVAAHDPRQGAMFYVLPQTPVAVPQLARDARCLSCHLSTAAEGVPGFFVRSIPTAADGTTIPWLGNYTTDHRSPVRDRWGGWYVTANHDPGPHLGNALIPDPNARELPPWNPRGHATTLRGVNAEIYPSPHSDIVAFLVFDHQARMMNLLTRIGWEARVNAQGANTQDELEASARELVDYLMFIDEAPLDGVAGTSGFAERFAARGPRDRKGRSLRDLDLQRRLMRYPFSYMIYSEVFDALPADAKDAIYRRVWQILSGQESSPRYLRVSGEDRRAIRDILRDTKPGLPAYFR